MDGFMITSLFRWVSVGLLVLGLAGPAWSQGAPPEDVPPWLADLIDRLDDIETKLDNQSTDLRGVTQNWDKKLDSTNGEADGCNSDRFTCLWPDDTGQATAVRDNETGLVWDRSPIANLQNWEYAILNCALRVVGGRKGWSLPMREQLASLVGASNSDLALPTGHPFQNVQSTYYWSASTSASDPADAWNVNFTDGEVFLAGKGSPDHAWCVRGGQVYDGQDVLRAP